MTDPEHQSHTRVTQAGEYVLGTLDADERRHFERELADDPNARRELEYWERRLGAIGLSLAPVLPPARVWQAIGERAFDSNVTPMAAASVSESARETRKAPGVWQGLAIAASVAALVMAALLFSGLPSNDGGGAGNDQAEPAYASMVYDAPTGTSWLVTAGDNSDALSVTAMGRYDLPKGKVLRAWLVPADGKPVALGKWPHTPGVHRLPVSKTAAGYMKRHASLMVSMEDAGFDPDSGPAGRLMWTSPIAQRTG